MPQINETRFLVQRELCKCKCRLNESVCNSKQKQNHDEYWCEYNELYDQSSCKDYYMWNRNTYDCECNITCKIDDYLNIKKCLCKKSLIGKLVLAQYQMKYKIQLKRHLTTKK